MKVNELARLAGVPAHVVRYYARIGLLSPDRDPHNAYRRFGPRDGERLVFIRVARRLGCSLEGIRATQVKLRAGNATDLSARRLPRPAGSYRAAEFRDIGSLPRCVARRNQTIFHAPPERGGKKDLAAIGCARYERLPPLSAPAYAERRGAD